MPVSTDVDTSADLVIDTNYPFPVHQLKTTDPYFDAVRTGAKAFDIRRDDRNFQPGDLLLLRHWVSGAGYTGPWVLRLISYVLREHPQVQTGYVVLGLQPVEAAITGRMRISGSPVPVSGSGRSAATRSTCGG